MAEGLGPPPEELRLAWRVKQWGALPNAGGLRDQPAGLIDKMAAAENVYQAIRAWRAATDWARWSQQNPDDWRICEMVIEMRKKDEHGVK